MSAELAPDTLAALQRAEQAARAGRLGEADGICRDVLRTQPGIPAALALRGTVLALEGRFREALPLLEPAIAAEPGQAAWRSTLADVYRLVGRLDDALDMGREALRLQPGNAGFLVNVGKTHADREEFADATAHFLAALAIDPEHANAHLAMAQVLLARGDWRPGWIEYEWRNRIEAAQGRIPHMNAPMWNGMAQPTGRILLVGDQGYGDIIQFARFVPVVAARCGEVVLACGADLVPLLSRIAGVGRAVSDWSAIPPFTSWCLLSSLPYVLGLDEAGIAAAAPYLVADPDRTAAWHNRLRGALPRGRRVGIVWSGRSTHPNDFRRSVALELFAPLLETPGAAFVSLQRDMADADATALAAMSGVVLLGDALVDFGESAALVMNLDLVISVDTAVAHLAGALGIPVWLLAPRPSDWRWLLDRADTPWYPTMRLFRQATPGDWDSVFAPVQVALADWIAAG